MPAIWTTKPAGQYTCDCGAVYEKTMVRVPIRETDRIHCRVCADEMDSWSSVFVPSYELTQTPASVKVA